MKCRYCHRSIYFTGILYRLVAGGSDYCTISASRQHAH